MNNRKYYYLEDTEQKGPYTFDELLLEPINRNTWIWHLGLDQWIEVRNIPELNDYVIQISPPPIFTKNIDSSSSCTETSRRPKNYLIESILITSICCIPLGVVALIQSIKVDRYYEKGDYKNAEQSSKSAQQYIILGLILGIVGGVLYILLLIASEL